MSDGPLADYDFLPWSRQGLASFISEPDSLDDELDANLSMPVRLQLNSALDARVDLTLYGPGDVVGIDPGQVIRTEPVNQTKDYIPNYLPAVEFARSDLPWVLAPAAADGRDRLRPWICLVVAERRDGVTLDFGDRSALPTLSIDDPAVPADELPPLEESWAWAHVQVAGGLDGGTLDEARPRNVASRLVCPRRLLPNRDYVACVVPVYGAGVNAGLGLPSTGPTLALAWAAGAVPASIRLPVYYHWEFSTGAAGDFEALARLLEPREVPPTVGVRPMDVSRPGFGMPDTPAATGGRILDLEGALRATTAERTNWPAAARDPFQASLRATLDAPAAADPEDEPGPLVAPPAYGRWLAAQTTIPDDRPRWFRQLNLDPRERTVAGFGTVVVQDQQESLMHSAWEQVEDVVAANRLLKRAQLSRSVGDDIVRNDLEPLDADYLLQLIGPLHTRLRMSPVTLAKTLQDSVVPDAASSPEFRRVSRPRGGLARRVGPAGGGVRPYLRRLNDGEIASAGPRTKPAGAVSPGDASGALEPSWLPSRLRPLLRRASTAFLVLFVLSLITAIVLIASGQSPVLFGVASAVAVVSLAITGWAHANRHRWRSAETLRSMRFSDDEVQAVAGRPSFALLEQTAAPRDARTGEAGRDGDDNAQAAAFRAAATEFQASLATRVELARPADESPLDLTSVRRTVLARIDPAITVKALVDQRIALAPGLWDPGVDLGDDLEPIMAYPEFETPMYEAFRDISQDLLVPGLEDIAPNTVTLLETNPQFIEAYMVGLNHEMGRELLWREFPTDQRGSYFRQFWDVRGRMPPPTTDSEREQARDVPEIHRWDESEDLGENMTGGSVEGSLVLLVRGELLRRFPTAMVYMAKAAFEVGENGEQLRTRVPTEEERYPLFRGTLRPDITFVGFDLDDDDARGDTDPAANNPGWFMVIQEQPTDARFGLDVATGFAGELGTLRNWSDLTWGHLAAGGQEFDAMTHIRVEAPLPETSQVVGPGVWGRNSAHMAFVTLQLPVRIAIHADDMLPPA